MVSGLIQLLEPDSFEFEVVSTDEEHAINSGRERKNIFNANFRNGVIII
jgi:hypothetical protein